MIDTSDSKNIVIDLLAGLKEIAGVYNEAQTAAGEIRAQANAMYTPEYLEQEIEKRCNAIYEKAVPLYAEMFKKIEELEEMLDGYNKDLELDNTELIQAITFLGAAKEKADPEVLHALADKFAGHRKALHSLSATVPEEQKHIFTDRMLNVPGTIGELKETIESSSYSFPDNIAYIMPARQQLANLCEAVGQELTDQELDLGADWQKIVTLQYRAALGL